MSNLEIETKKVELLRVQAARAEMKLIIMQREAEIERVKLNIEKQLVREKELEAEINQLIKS
jgi:hypothetical protein